MGANQAIESSACLVNELQKAIQLSPNGKLEFAALRSALENYASLRVPRTSTIQQRAGTVYRAQLRHDGPAAAFLRELPTMTDSDWLLRGLMSMSEATMLEGIPLTTRGTFYRDAMETYPSMHRDQIRRKQSRFLSLSHVCLILARIAGVVEIVASRTLRKAGQCKRGPMRQSRPRSNQIEYHIQLQLLCSCLVSK